MQPKSIGRLAECSDAQLFDELAAGLALVVKNVGRLRDGAASLKEGGKHHAGRVLNVLAEEEGAKFLILLDAVRCPRQPSGTFARQLKRFNSHLEKGIYAKACSYRPTTLAELQTYVDLDRHQYYLDGPNDVDWIFRNEILDARDSALYVDYVAYDDGHRWSDPAYFEEMGFGMVEPSSVAMARYMDAAGVSSASALATIAEVWRPESIGLDTRSSKIAELNLATLRLLDERGHLNVQTEEVFTWILRNWQFPMYALDLDLVRNDLNQLREQRQAWTPE